MGHSKTICWNTLFVANAYLPSYIPNKRLNSAHCSLFSLILFHIFFVDYECIGVYFSTKNLHKKVDMATARRGHPTRTTTNLRGANLALFLPRNCQISTRFFNWVRTLIQIDCRILLLFNKCTNKGHIRRNKCKK